MTPEKICLAHEWRFRFTAFFAHFYRFSAINLIKLSQFNKFFIFINQVVGVKQEIKKMMEELPAIPKTDIIFSVVIHAKSDDLDEEINNYTFNFYGFDTPIKVEDFQNFYVNFNNETRTNPHLLSFQGIKSIDKVDSFYDTSQKTIIILSTKKSGEMIGYFIGKNQKNEDMLHAIFPAKIFNDINPKTYNPREVLEDILKNKSEYENVMMID